MSQELSPEEKQLLNKELKKAANKIVASRLPDNVTKEAEEVLSILDEEFSQRKWYYGYDDGFHTLHKYDFGTDTDGKPCHVVFYMNFDTRNGYTSVNIDSYNNDYGSNGVMALLLSHASPYDNHNIRSGLADELVERVDAFKSLRKKADLFISKMNKMLDQHDQKPYSGKLNLLFEERIEKILGDPQRQTDSGL